MCTSLKNKIDDSLINELTNIVAKILCDLPKSVDGVKCQYADESDFCDLKFIFKQPLSGSLSISDYSKQVHNAIHECIQKRFDAKNSWSLLNHSFIAIGGLD